MKLRRFALAIVLIVVFAGCAAAPPQGSQTPQHEAITPGQAMEMMSADAVILDVRTPEEFMAEHIENAILLPVEELAERAAEFLPNPEQVILIYCRSGRRSEDAWHILAELGYQNIYDFGGIIQWSQTFHTVRP